MSRELAYFPPYGTKWKWESKTLKYSPWACCLSVQREPHLVTRPLKVMLFVDLVDARYRWTVEVTDFEERRYSEHGVADEPLKACCDAERCGEAKLDELLPEWVRIALANRWRPPLRWRWTA